MNFQKLIYLPVGSLPHIPQAEVELYDGESFGLAIEVRTPTKYIFIIVFNDFRVFSLCFKNIFNDQIRFLMNYMSLMYGLTMRQRL